MKKCMTRTVPAIVAWTLSLFFISIVHFHIEGQVALPE